MRFVDEAEVKVEAVVMVPLVFDAKNISPLVVPMVAMGGMAVAFF